VSALRFKGDATGQKPSTQARVYVYNVLVAMIDSELTESEGWMFGGIEADADRRRLKRALHKVRAELLRKARRS